jgi:hypothetical protein
VVAAVIWVMLLGTFQESTDFGKLPQKRVPALGEHRPRASKINQADWLCGGAEMTGGER